MAGAALGASAITALASLGVTWASHWLAGREADRARQEAGRIRQREVYQDVLSLSIKVAARSAVLGRLFWDEHPSWADPNTISHTLEIYDWWANDFQGLRAAVVRLWVAGTPDAVKLGDMLVECCAELWVISPNVPKPESGGEWKRGVDLLGRIQGQFARVARRDLGRESIDIGELSTELLPRYYRKPAAEEPDQKSTAKAD